MNQGIMLAIVGVAILLLGFCIGYWIARSRLGARAAKADDVQRKFDAYRHDVTEHFGRTAEHFQAIGRQYRELYEHMASGADSLCDREAIDRKLDFEPAAILEPLADELATGTDENETAESSPRDYADDDAPTVADDDGKTDDLKPEVKADADDGPGSRTYH
ncbi:MAG: DUF1043 family protein [Woeseiaceae bacterium]|nr:DUF1043 family protein [Woeseiaceae bacterium]